MNQEETPEIKSEEENTDMTNTVRYGPFKINLLPEIMASCKFSPGQEVTKHEMSNAVALNSALSTEQYRRQLSGGSRR